MKTINKIFISIFLILIIFIAQDDINTAFNKGVLYLEEQIDQSENAPVDISEQKEDIASVDAALSKPVTKAKQQEHTPPPLKIISSTINVDNTATNADGGAKLSLKGIIELTNKERSNNGGLESLKENYKLNLSAQKKLEDMFAKQYFEHVSPSGVGVSDLAAQVSYEYLIIGENLAYGDFNDNKALVDAWMASPGHRANILNKNYSEIGVAVARGMYQGHEVWMAVQHFGKPKSACPAVDEVLRGSISIDQKNAANMEADLKTRKQHIDSGAVHDGMTTNEQIQKYNELVKVYNELILSIKQKITLYNDQVKAFNACISSSTSS